MILLWQTNPDDNIPITDIDDATKEINNYREFIISSDIDYEEVADIFVKINSKGTRIRITELLLALLALKIPGEFRKDFRDYIEKTGR